MLPAAALVLAAGAVLLVYAGAQYRATDYFGFTDGRGWAMYARVAPFAVERLRKVVAATGIELADL